MEYAVFYNIQLENEMSRMGYRVSRKFAKEMVRASNRAAKQRTRELEKERKNNEKALKQRVNEKEYGKYLEVIELLQSVHKRSVLRIDWIKLYSLIDKKDDEYHKKLDQYSLPVIFRVMRLDKWYEKRNFEKYDKMLLLSFEEILEAPFDKCEQIDVVKVNQLIQGIRKQELNKMIELYKIFFDDEKMEYGIRKWDYQFVNKLFYIRGYYSLEDFPERKRMRLDSGEIGNRKMSISDKNKLIWSHVRSASLWKAKSTLGLLPLDGIVVEVLETSEDESKLVSSWHIDVERYKEMKSSAVSDQAVELAGHFADDFRVRDGYRPISGYFDSNASRLL